MASLLQCAGADVQGGRISAGQRGTWWAELVLATDTPPTGRVTIEAVGGLSLVGTVQSGGEFLLTTTVRIVGGAGGLSLDVMGAFQAAQLRDPLNAIMEQTDEKLSNTVAAEVLAVPLDRWTLGKCTAVRALDELCTEASAHLGSAIGWRVLSDGTVWLGAETWPQAAMPDDSVIAEQFPAEGRTVIGCSTPAISVGVNLDTVGLVRGVDHYIEPRSIRTHVWDRDQPDAIGRVLSMLLAAVGLDYSGAPRIDRLAHYRATVKAAASDGSTVDVQPASDRLEAMQRVPLRLAAGIVAVPKNEAAPLLAWDEGNPGLVHALPLYEPGATFAKISATADAINFNSGTKGAVRVDDKVAADTSMATWIAAAQVVLAAAAALTSTPAPVAPTDFGKASTGSSTVKVG